MPELQKRCLSMKSKTLSLKSIIKKMDFQRKTVAIQGNAWKKKIAVVCKQINWKNTWSSNAKEHYQSFIRKTQNQ